MTPWDDFWRQFRPVQKEYYKTTDSLKKSFLANVLADMCEEQFGEGKYVNPANEWRKLAQSHKEKQ